MTTATDTLLEQMRSAAAVVEHARRAADAAEALRDRLMRQARAEGISAITISKTLEMHRSRVYVILTEHPEEDPQLDELLDSAWDEAMRSWEAAGREGQIDDYFPLEALLARP